jgi:hypothetical protein
MILHSKVDRLRGAPQRLTLDVVGFGLADRHARRRGRLGNTARNASSSFSSSPRRSFVGFQLTPSSAATWAITGAASSPRLLSIPTCLERLLRLACRSWVRVCSVLRSLSRRLEGGRCRVRRRAWPVAFSQCVDVVAQVLDVEHAQSSAVTVARGAHKPPSRRCPRRLAGENGHDGDQRAFRMVMTVSLRCCGRA